MTKFSDNLRCQALLGLANLIGEVEYGNILFTDFKLLNQVGSHFKPYLTKQQGKGLNLVNGLFGTVSTEELLSIVSTFDFWNTPRSIGSLSFSDNDKARMQEVLSDYNISHSHQTKSKVINGVTFYYDDLDLTDNLVQTLEDFSLSAEDKAYSIYLDEGHLVVY